MCRLCKADETVNNPHHYLDNKAVSICVIQESKHFTPVGLPPDML